MTVDIDRELRVPLHSLPTPATVAIIAERDLLDAALVALVERLGFHTVLVDLDLETGPVRPMVAVVRSDANLARLRSRAEMQQCVIAAIGIDIRDAPGVAIADSPLAARRLQQVLEETARRRPTLRNRVNITARELEILSTYALGATLRETSQTHFVAESTVRAHYRRVSQRYADAGRPVSNKSQLLLQFMADGWVQRRPMAV
ncbi:helix-turn-helix transcriptional regulator [Gordonia insulae]|uniref:HTH luxR-type domain-containing protein n=1 Tax=Gordonia insulae TaxID=2420509 RepID=A0A3G8JNW2_9ACTN|nr:DNA-binding response regulator [Gordonia insulae]AZG46706.1 hypothetical protein D7316_03307 [Gordonia insulae]